MGKFSIGDLVTRDGTDIHKVVRLDDDGQFGLFECIKSPASGWINPGESEYNMAGRYTLICDNDD